jgi:hypothetical protein
MVFISFFSQIQLNPFITNIELKASFRYNRLIYKEIYAIGENDVLSYKRVFVITESVIKGLTVITQTLYCFIDKL